jgi:hypothetical protein
MNEVILLLLAIVGVFSVACSAALLALGKMIDLYPVGDESGRQRGLASPVETTKIAVVLFWPLFIVGAWAVLQESRFIVIAGITTLFSICLFMFTALVFSFAVLSAMRSRRERAGAPITPALSTEPAFTPVKTKPVPSTGFVVQKRYNNPITDFMVDALLKKE